VRASLPCDPLRFSPRPPIHTHHCVQHNTHKKTCHSDTHPHRECPHDTTHAKARPVPPSSHCHPCNTATLATTPWQRLHPGAACLPPSVSHTHSECTAALCLAPGAAAPDTGSRAGTASSSAPHCTHTVTARAASRLASPPSLLQCPPLLPLPLSHPHSEYAPEGSAALHCASFVLATHSHWCAAPVTAALTPRPQ
jgi:hypothetical protein